MTFHFSNDVFRQNFALESTDRILYGFALLQSDFCHAHPPTYNSATRISYSRTFRISSFAARAAPASLKPELLADAVTAGGSAVTDPSRFKIATRVASLTAARQRVAVWSITTNGETIDFNGPLR